MKYLVKLGAALAILPILAFSHSALAASEGQIEGGDIYRVKNITKNVDFTDPASADSCNTLMYKVRIHDPGPGALTSVNVKATLPAGVSNTNTSTVTVSAINASPASTSDTATVNLSSALALSYISGSTQLLDANNNVLSSLPDGILGGGVTIGDVGVSIDNKRFVQFQVKTDCTPPVTPAYSCTALNLTTSNGRKVDASVTYAVSGGAAYKSTTFDWGDSLNNSTSGTTFSHTYGKDGTYTINATLTFTVSGTDKTASCPAKQVTFTTTTPPVVVGKTLPNTGPGSTVAIFAGVSLVAGAAHYMWNRRFQS